MREMYMCHTMFNPNDLRLAVYARKSHTLLIQNNRTFYKKLHIGLQQNSAVCRIMEEYDLRISADHSFIHSFTHSFIHSVIHSRLFTLSFIRGCLHWGLKITT